MPNIHLSHIHTHSHSCRKHFMAKDLFWASNLSCNKISNLTSRKSFLFHFFSCFCEGRVLFPFHSPPRLLLPYIECQTPWHKHGHELTEKMCCYLSMITTTNWVVYVYVVMAKGISMNACVCALRIWQIQQLSK